MSASDDTKVFKAKIGKIDMGFRPRQRPPAHTTPCTMLRDVQQSMLGVSTLRDSIPNTLSEAMNVLLTRPETDPDPTLDRSGCRARAAAQFSSTVCRCVMRVRLFPVGTGLSRGE